MDAHILPGVDQTVGRLGMEMWRFPGHADVRDDDHYQYQTVVDNVCPLRPALRVEVNRLIVESGHGVAGKKPGAPWRGRCDSFVVETDVHYPTDVSLLWDTMRSRITRTGRAATGKGVPGWRQWRHLLKTLRRRFHRAQITRRAPPECVEAYLTRCRELVLRVEERLPALASILTSLAPRNFPFLTAPRRFLSHTPRTDGAESEARPAFIGREFSVS